MTDPLDAYGDALRRALHAEADAVVPAPDGLDRIRTRIGERQRRFGWAWFTETWARPAVALAAAVFIAVIAIAATPAINAIEGITAGDRGSAGGGGPDRSVGNGTSVPGGNGNPGQQYPGGVPSQLPASTPSPLSSPSVGAPTCDPSTSAHSTATATPRGAHGPVPCSSAGDSTSPTPDPVTTPPSEPPTSDTPSVTSEPPGPQEQQQQAGQSQP